MLTRYQVKHYFKSDPAVTVCLARQTELDKLFVIKRLRTGLEEEERFYWETQVLKHLKHPCIPLLYDIQKDEDYYYIIEEYVEGESLKSAVSRRTFSISTAIRYTIQLCDILEYLHGHSSGEILYLDCQPDNIILSEDTLFLVDFGNSVYSKDFARRNYRYGTVGYAAPELYEKQADVTPATDVYGVGALLYYMLTGVLPPTGEVRSIKKIPKKLLNVIRKCMRHNPGQRYGSMKELSDALQKLYFKSVTKKSKETTNLVISIAGADRRVGVTHLGMSLANYLEKKGYCCLFAEQTNPGILMKMMECQSGRELCVKEGVFWYKGIRMMPYYGKTVDSEFEKIKKKGNKQVILIKDYGILCDEINEDYSKGDVCLLVGDGKPWEFTNFLEKISLTCSEKSFFVVNLADGALFYKLTKGQKDSFIRMPYFRKWWSPGRVGSDFLEALSCEILRKGGGE